MQSMHFLCFYLEYTLSVRLTSRFKVRWVVSETARFYQLVGPQVNGQDGDKVRVCSLKVYPVHKEHSYLLCVLRHTFNRLFPKEVLKIGSHTPQNTLPLEKTFVSAPAVNTSLRSPAWAGCFTNPY